MPQKILFFIFTLTLLSGCDQLQSTPDTVILDIDAIANATGQAATIKKQIETANNELTIQLQNISATLNEKLASEKKKLGKKLSSDDKKNMQELTLQANQKMQQARTLANQKSQQYKASLVLELRESIQPIAEKIARSRGADIVTISNNSLIWFNPDIDITDEIIAEIRAKSSISTDKDATIETEIKDEAKEE